MLPFGIVLNRMDLKIPLALRANQIHNPRSKKGVQYGAPPEVKAASELVLYTLQGVSVTLKEWIMLNIITAEQRLQEKKGHKIVICAGQSGVGKTSLCPHTDPSKTLFMDLEAGDAAIGKGVAIDVIRPRTWQRVPRFCVFLVGQTHLWAETLHIVRRTMIMCVRLMETQQLFYLSTIQSFVDSITVAGRLCFQHCQNQPECKSERTGKLDTRSAYGLQGREMMAWLSSHLQHIRDKNVIFVGILDRRLMTMDARTYELQIEGSKRQVVGKLPGIVDRSNHYALMPSEDGNPYRCVCLSDTEPVGIPCQGQVRQT